MKEPNGTDLLKTLIKLLAEQEGVSVKCEIEEGRKNNESEKASS